jgi:uncharacterized protein YqeY
MTKLLLTEILRQQQLMGKTLIVEQFVQLADDIITFLGKMSGKLSDETIQLTKKLGTAVSDQEVVEILSKLVKSNDEVARYIIPKIMSTLTDAELKAIADVKYYLRKQITDGKITPAAANKMAQNWADKKVVSPFDEVKNIIKKDLFDFVNNEVKKINKAKWDVTLNPNIANTITGVAGKTWDEIIPLSTQELKKLEKLYRTKGLGQSFFKQLKLFGQEVVNMMTKQFKLMDETLSLIKSLDTYTNAAQRTDILKKIGDNIKFLTQRDIDNFTIIDEWINTNVLDYSIKNKIRGFEGYQKAAALLDPNSLETWKKTYGNFWTRRGNLIKQTNSMLNPRSWFGDNIAKWEGTSTNAKRFNKWKAFFTGPEFAELRRYATLGQTQSWKGIQNYSKQFGAVPAVLNVSKELVYSYVVLSAVMAFTDYITDIFGNLVRNVPYLNEWGPVYKQILSYDEHIKKEDSNNSIDEIEGYLLFGQDMWNYYLDELKSLDGDFPGFSDDFGSLLKFLREFAWTKEDVDKIIAQSEKAKIEAQKAQEKVVDDAEKLGKRASNTMNKIEDTPLGFKAFILKDWIDPTTKKSQLTGNETYSKKGNEYTVNDGANIYYYIYEGTTFKNTKITDLSGNILKNQ